MLAWMQRGLQKQYFSSKLWDIISDLWHWSFVPVFATATAPSARFCLPAPCRINVAGAGIQEYNCEKVVLIIQRSLCLPALYITFHFLHSFLRWPMQRAVNASRTQHHRASFLSQKAFYQLNTEHTQNCVWHPFRQMFRMKSALWTRCLSLHDQLWKMC